MLITAFKQGKILSKGTNLFDSEVQFCEDDNFKSLIDALDNRIGYFQRKELIVFMGISNVGKSWSLIHCGKAALLQKKKIVHITLEMSKENIKNRYYQSIGAMVKEKEGRLIARNGNEWFAKSIYSDRQLLKNKLKFLQQLGGDLQIVEYGAKQCSINTIRHIIDSLEIESGFNADVLLIDYPDYMKSMNNYSEKRHELSSIFEDIHAFTKEKCLTTIVVSQVNRAAYKKRTLNLDDIAEDISKVNISDMIIPICQTEEEEKSGKARLYLKKARNIKKGLEILIEQNYDTGQFCTCSKEIVRENSLSMNTNLKY